LSFRTLSETFPNLQRTFGLLWNYLPGLKTVAVILLKDPRWSNRIESPKGAKSMSEVEREIRKLEEELTQTEMRLDFDALDRIYADDIMVTAPIGICVDKPAVMNEVRQAAEKAIVGRYDKDNLKIRAYGDLAISSYRMTAWATFEEKEIKRALCITNVWMKRNGHWQIIARHTASLPGDTPPAEICS